MKNIVFGVVLTTMVAASALAQTTTPPAQTPATPGPTTAPSATPVPEAGAPLPGANSFTEGQAKSRIEQLGYSNVTGLTKDSDGVWRGTAMKDGRSHAVAVDFRGNLVIGQK